MDLNELWPSEIPGQCNVSAKMVGPETCLASESKMADSQPPQPSEDSMPKHAEVEKVLQVNQVDQPFMPICNAFEIRSLPADFRRTCRTP